jgi:cell division protein FtsL
LELTDASNLVDSFHRAGLSGFEIILAMFVLGIVIVLIILVWKVVPKWVQKRSEITALKIQRDFSQTENENNMLLKSHNDRFDKIERILDNISKNNNYLETRLNTLKSLIYNDNVPIVERLECFNDYIKLGGNGNCRKFCAKLILANQSVWDSILNKDTTDFTDDERKKSYENALADLKKGLW